MSFAFLTATEIRFGRGAVREALGDIGGKGERILLVHGANPARSDWLEAALKAEGRLVSRFACPGEPELAQIEQGAALARDADVDLVVALGGGSVIDCGKAIAAIAPATRPIHDHLEVVGKGLPLDKAPLPFIAIPTTSGTGAEVTKNAVIGVPESKRKVSLRDNRMLADLAIVDPALTDDCPRAVTLASGMDAIAQVIEPYVSRKANRLTDALCREAIPLGLTTLKRLMTDLKDIGARDDMAWVSLCGGLALANSGLGAVHGLAGPIGGVANAPHGAICGALLPHVLKANRENADATIRTRLDQISDWIAGAYGVQPAAAFDYLETWARECGLPGLGGMGVEKASFEIIADSSLSSSSMKGNPVALDKAALKAILEQAF